MLFSVKFYRYVETGFFHYPLAEKIPMWRYVLLLKASGSDMAYILKNNRTYLRVWRG